MEIYSLFLIKLTIHNIKLTLGPKFPNHQAKQLNLINYMLVKIKKAFMNVISKDQLTVMIVHKINMSIH